MTRPWIKVSGSAAGFERRGNNHALVLWPALASTLFPAAVSTAGAFVLIPLSPALIFGFGPFPQLGISAGAAGVVL
jgi:hypothetical protein